MQLGGEPAAAELDGYLQPGIATFYGEKVPGKFIADHHLRTNPKGDVALRKRFWNFEYAWKWPISRPRSSVQLQTCATFWRARRRVAVGPRYGQAVAAGRAPARAESAVKRK